MPLPHSKQRRTKGQHNVLDQEEEWRKRQHLGAWTLALVHSTSSHFLQTCSGLYPLYRDQGMCGWSDGPKGPKGLMEESPKYTVFPCSCRGWERRHGGWSGDRRSAERPFQSVRPRLHSCSGLSSPSPSIPLTTPPVPGPEIA